MTVFPQLIVFIILMTLVSVIFFLFMKKYKRDDSLVESDSNYWVCGCYRNQDVRFCVYFNKRTIVSWFPSVMGLDILST